MRIPTSTFLLASVAASMALTAPTYATGLRRGVFSNVNSVQDMSPQAVFSHLMNCADLPPYDIPEGSYCLFEKYIEKQFPGQTWGDVCLPPPNITFTEIVSNFEMATYQCSDFIDDSFIQTASILVIKVLSVDSCWIELCERDDIVPLLESEYIEKCVAVEIPYPVGDSSTDMFLDDYHLDSVLTCMLEYVMDNPAVKFDLEEPPSQCYPPGYQHMNEFCPEILALQALEHCVDSTFIKNDDMSMSFDYEMSMKMETTDDGLPDYFEIHEEFCHILERVSSQLECLDAVCNSQLDAPNQIPTSVPSSAPSDTPSIEPSTVPFMKLSVAPTSAPSMYPSNAPSAAPSLRPSATPSVSWSKHPSNAPSATPSLRPSAAPSVTRPMDDSEVITNPDIVDSSAEVSSPAILVGLVCLILPFLLL